MNKKRISFDEYTKLVGGICRDISAGDWRPDYVVGLTRGGLLAATMISHYFDIPMHTLEVKLRDHANTESNLWMSEDAYGYNTEIDLQVAKNILIVDDINDTGATLNWIMQDWQSSCLPSDERWKYVWNKNVKFAVVVDNLASDCKVSMDFAAMEINKAENDVWIDFPYESWWM
jgi:xanthine phosphoribosyltransferase